MDGHLELDKFKPINDRLGHEQGDRALTIFSYALRLSTRPDDELYRTGGDEFIVIMDVSQPVNEDFYKQISRRLHA